MIRLEVQGIEQFRAQLKALGPEAQAEAENGLVDEMRKMMSEAQRKVPVYSGELRGSAFVRTAARNQSRTDWTFGYSAPYAMFVHEHPNAHTNADGHACACYATIHRPRPGMLRNGQGYRWLAKVVEAHGDIVGPIFRRVRNAVLVANGQRNGPRPSTPAVPEAGGVSAASTRGQRKGRSSRGGGGGSAGAYLRELLKLAARGGK